jgi:methylmalonic acid semialdehyde dehydrogenase
MACANINNWDGKAEVAPSSGEYMDVTSPVDGSVIGKVAVSSSADVAAAVERASAVFGDWSSRTIKSRAAVMFKFHQLLIDRADELADIIIKENGKNRSEALASIAKGNETVEYACSLPQIVQGKKEEVSRGVFCEDMREPLGIVGAIVPFNFPIMVPMWTLPISLTMGNCVILKPSEKVPMTMRKVAELLLEAGVPPGVFQMVNGTKDVVEALCDHPNIRGITFVGSSPVAQIVSSRCRGLNKKVIALGGAKNHLVCLPDCEVNSAANDIVTSFAGAAGQRCMAASVLLIVGNEGSCADVLDKVVAKAALLKPGVGPGEVGPVIDHGAKERILGYINNAVDKDGATCLVDGRGWATGAGGPGATPGGSWVGPTVLLHKSAENAAVREEIFGPVLSVVRVDSWEEAIRIENSNPFGNAACIYTSVGAHANWFSARFRAGMIGVNVGIPVPREPFAFGGLYGTLSKFGDMDITGEGCIEFFSNRRKVTSRWPCDLSSKISAPKSSAAAAEKDVANFNGQM